MKTVFVLHLWGKFLSDKGSAKLIELKFYGVGDSVPFTAESQII